MKSIVALGAIVLCHYGYDFASNGPQESSYWFYVFRGVEGVALCWLLLPVFQAMKGWQRTIGVFAVILGMFEEAQTAVCGVAGMGISVPLWSTLCVERFGYWPYLALTALALTLVIKGIRTNEARH